MTTIESINYPEGREAMALPDAFGKKRKKDQTESVINQLSILNY
jgi:hypothetical protein